MIDVILRYVAGGNDLPGADSRGAPVHHTELTRAPVVGEFIASEDRRGFVEVVNVAHASDGTVHAFVVPGFPPKFVTDAFGIAPLGMPSQEGFDGRTVRDLIQFLAQYPMDYPVTFSDRQRLVARAKGLMVLLRLDEAGS